MKLMSLKFCGSPQAQIRLELWMHSVIQGDLTVLSFLILRGATLSNIFRQCKLKEATHSFIPPFAARLLSNNSTNSSTTEWIFFKYMESVISRECLAWIEGRVSRLKERSNKIYLWSLIKMSSQQTAPISRHIDRIGLRVWPPLCVGPVTTWVKWKDSKKLRKSEAA